MANELYVAETLSQQMIEAGGKLIKRLDEAGSRVTAAFWFYAPEEAMWKLIIASPLVKSEGPRAYYKIVNSANKRASQDENIISLHNISVSTEMHPLIQALKPIISTDDTVCGIRISKSVMKGFFIEDSYIYRMNIVTNFNSEYSDKLHAEAG